MDHEQYLIDPAGLREISSARLGGKGANLARLQSAGLPVPIWYGLTTTLMEDILVSSGVAATITDLLNDLAGDTPLAAITGVGDRIRQAIAGIEFPESLLTLLRRQHRETLGDDCLFSVRSSAVDEDSGDASFAGLHDSFLYVSGFAELLEKIKQTWASAYNTRALVFRLENGLSVRSIRLAVIVQEMVAATVSGIVFTANPNNGEVRELLISSLYGAGEGIVSSGLAADLFYYAKATGEYRAVIASKEEQLIFDRRSGRGLIRSTVSPELRDQPSLSAEQIARIGATAITIELLFGRPQDIEFSLSAEGRLHILQARAITTLAEYGPAAGNRLIWDNSNIIESYSGPTSPMTFSFIRHAYTIVYHCFAEVMGIAPAEIRKNRHVFANMLGLFRGQVYYNLVNWYRLIRLFPGYNYNKAYLESMMGLKDKLELAEDEDQAPGLAARYLVELPKLVRLLGRSLVNFARLDRLVADFDRHFERHFQRWTALDFEAMAPHQLLEVYREMEEELLWKWKTPIINDFYVMIFYGTLKKLCIAWCRDVGGSLQNDLICGGGDIESTKPTKMLMEIAARIGSDAALKRLFLEKSPETLATIIPRLAQAEEIYTAVTEYLDRYGFRCINELKLEEPSLKETPQFVYQMLQNYLNLANPEALDQNLVEMREREIRGEAERTAFTAIAARTPWLPRRTIFRWVLNSARKGVRNRENMRFARTKIYGRLRELLNAAGGHLATENLLEKPSDIYFLTIDELWDYVKGTAVTTDLKGLAALRKAEFARYRGADAPAPADHFETFGLAYHKNLCQSQAVDAVVEGGEGLQGIGCCPGVVRGIARVVQSPRDNLQLNGEILVAARTDPGWVPLYPAVSGILIERGSILSHSAIVAREMGIPTIVGIPNLLQAIADGQEVEMDGKTGRVTILKQDQSFT
ncbi:MAG: hypothetical protein HGA96_16285 [Desulfobulbaceae bacterium]|nr:hypothetical protein [Desulfobulbaceae bacterium]